jgi:hypothetical protein
MDDERSAFAARSRAGPASAQNRYRLVFYGALLTAAIATYGVDLTLSSERASGAAAARPVPEARMDSQARRIATLESQVEAITRGRDSVEALLGPQVVPCCRARGNIDPLPRALRSAGCIQVVRRSLSMTQEPSP